MNWGGSPDYLSAKRQIFRVNGTLAGYVYIVHYYIFASITNRLFRYLLWLIKLMDSSFVKKAKNFAEVVILNAGHSVSADQPLAALKLMRTFVADKL